MICIFPCNRLYGGYEKLFFGVGEEALEDLTGGISEGLMIGQSSAELHDRITKIINRSSLITCGIAVSLMFKHF